MTGGGGVVFFLGFACGGVLGAWVTWLAACYVGTEPVEKHESMFPLTGRNRTCPPCTQECDQGDDCRFRPGNK